MIAHIHGVLEAIGEIAEESRRKVGECMQACEVDHHDDGKTDEPGLIQLLAWRVGWCYEHNAEKDASENEAEDEGERIVACAEDYIASLRHILVVIDFFEDSHLLELLELLASLPTDLRADDAVILVVLS